MSRSAILERSKQSERPADIDVSARNAELNHGARTFERRDKETQQPNDDEIAILAYSLWEEGGCRDGCADEDWFRAEEILKSDKSSAAG